MTKYENGIDAPELDEKIADVVVPAAAIMAAKDPGESYTDALVKMGLLAIIFIGVGLLFVDKSQPFDEAVTKVVRFWSALIIVACMSPIVYMIVGLIAKGFGYNIF